MARRVSIFIVLHFICVIAKNIPESPVKNTEEILDVSICSGLELTSDCEKVCENENLKPLCTQLNLGLCVCEFPTQNNELNDKGKAVIIKLELNQTDGFDINKQKNMNDGNSASNSKVQNEQQGTAQNQEKEHKINNKVNPNVKEATEEETISKTSITGQNQLEKDPQKEVMTPKNEITSLIEVHPQPNIATLDHEGSKVKWSVKPFAWKLKDQDNKQSGDNTLKGDRETNVDAESDAMKNDKMRTLEQSKDEKAATKNITHPEKTAEIKQSIDTPTLKENNDRNQPLTQYMTGSTIPENNIKEHGHQIEKPEINEETTTPSLNDQNTSKTPEEVKQNNGNRYLEENKEHKPGNGISKQLIINSGELNETDEFKNTESSGAGKDNELIQIFDKAKKENIILDQTKESVSGNLLPKSESDIDLFISNETFIMSGVFIYIVLCLLFLYARSYRKKKYVRLPLLQHEDDTNNL